MTLKRQNVPQESLKKVQWRFHEMKTCEEAEKKLSAAFAHSSERKDFHFLLLFFFFHIAKK